MIVWYYACMDIQRTITILIEPDPDLERTLEAFREVQNALSEPCWNSRRPPGALALQRLMYHEVKGSLSAQMTISAIRTVIDYNISCHKQRATEGARHEI